MRRDMWESGSTIGRQQSQDPAAQASKKLLTYLRTEIVGRASVIDRPDGKRKKDGAKRCCITKFLVSEYFPRLPIYKKARKGRNSWVWPLYVTEHSSFFADQIKVTASLVRTSKQPLQIASHHCLRDRDQKMTISIKST